MLFIPTAFRFMFLSIKSAKVVVQKKPLSNNYILSLH